VLWQHAVLCNVMLRRVACYGCAFCASLRDRQRSTEHTSVAGHSSQHNTTRHAATTPNWYSEINVTFYSVTLARTIRLSDDGPRTETCRSVFNDLICKFYTFYICGVVGIIIEYGIISLHGTLTFRRLMSTIVVVPHR